MIVIIDYGMGNIGSILNMLKKIGAKAVASSDTTIIENADKLILPGVGSFDKGMQGLTERGLVPLLNKIVLQERKPILGLCLGMQLFTKRSDEGHLQGLGWLNAETIKFKFNKHNQNLKIPHMGWNWIKPCKSSPLFNNLGNDCRFYFVHSYHVVCADQKNALAHTNYGFDFTSMTIEDNIIGAQFHPEKSHKFGMQLLINFAENF
jgi:imidazole glycerol-phosphate synthase subunit HisH